MFWRKLIVLRKLYSRLGVATLVLAILMYLVFSNFLHAQATFPIVEFSSAQSSGSEAITSVNIPVKITGTFSDPVTVKYQAIGGNARGINEGSGQDYILNSGTLTFAVGETSKNLVLTIKEDVLNETDETIEIMLSNPANATLDVNTIYTYKIIDNDRNNLVKVTDYGARGDGVTNDTAAIQSASDYVYSHGGGVVYFPPATYKVAMVYIRENVTYEGYGAVLKRLSRSELVNYYISIGKTATEADAEIKWTKTFTTQKYPYSGSVDSKPLVVKGLSFDGNLVNQGYYQEWQLEQAHFIFLTAGTSGPGRLKAFVEDTTMENGVADGVSINTNIDLAMYNNIATNVFRGAFVAVGGYSKARVKNLTTRQTITGVTYWQTGIDVEVEEEGKGYNLSQAVELYLENLDLDGDFDIAVRNGSIVEAKNIISSAAPFLLGAIDSNITITDSKFLVSKWDNKNWIVNSNNSKITFNNCEFWATEKGYTNPDFYDEIPESPVYPYEDPASPGSVNNELQAAPMLAWKTGTNITTNSTVTYNNCRFDVADDVEAGDIVYAFRNTLDYMARNNTLVVNGGYISDKFDYGFAPTYWSGRWRIKDVVNKAAMPYVWDGYASTEGDTYADIVLDGVVTQSSRYMTIWAHGGQAENHIQQKNIIIDQPANIIEGNQNPEGNNYTGNEPRIILGTSVPTSQTHCFVGDIYRLRNPTSTSSPNEWKCTKMGYTGVSSTWSVQPVLPAIANLVNLPSNPTLSDSAQITVGGPSVVAYKYNLDNRGYSNEFPISTLINLSNLSNGRHQITVIGKNASGLWQDGVPADPTEDAPRSTFFSWVVDKDTKAPVGLVSSDSGTMLADSTQVNLKLSSFDDNTVSNMRISNTGDFNTATTEIFSSSKNWTLLDGNGYKTVYVWLQDSKGNWTTANEPIVTTFFSTLSLSNIKITKNASQTTAIPGQVITYIIDIENNDSTPISDLKLTDGIPSGAEYISSSNNGQCDIVDPKLCTKVTWNLSNLAAGGMTTVNLSVKIK